MGSDPGPDAGGERLRRLLQDLVAFGSDAAYTVSMGLDAYVDEAPQGRLLRNNGRHVVIQIATVVEKLPDAYKVEHPDVDWVAIGRMRNLIAHHYDRVDGRLVFSALQRRIPHLLTALGLAPGPHDPPG